MKVLLCERSFSGHRKTYMQWLSRIEGIDFFSYAPENIGFPEERHFPFIYTKVAYGFILLLIRQECKNLVEDG